MKAEQTVYIIDDDDAVRDSIKELVESVNLNATTFSGAEEFLEQLKPECSGCIVLDVRMPNMSGLILQEKLKEIASTLPIIFISGHGDIDMAVSTLKSGAIDFIQKPYHDQSLLDSINNALALDRQNRQRSQESEELERYYGELTKREREILELILQGQSNKNISKSLNISLRTVEAHRQHILSKYHVKTTTKLLSLFNKSRDKSFDPT
jgi:two-component system, LuxR family, response regulator FixJ